ncbi:uncharacterized protein LOC108136831 [Drosophila elegans]|uniref:uncharacterized protein LOC108136831 n=1 Tax=Drosophila elegans TaxID=30023 RepID=UPI0007E85BC3|nr:uncharacterized protein LOC108136831 [Drosophila elegans]
MSATYFIFGCFFLGTTVALIFPQHNCSEYFTYGIDEDGSNIGIFTAKETARPQLNFSVIFAWKGSADIVPIRMYPNPSELYQNVQMGLRAQAYVKFVNVTEMMPMPARFYFNDELLCFIELRRGIVPYQGIAMELPIPLKTLRNVQKTRPKMHPIFPRIQPTIDIV